MRSFIQWKYFCLVYGSDETLNEVTILWNSDILLSAIISISYVLKGGYQIFSGLAKGELIIALHK